MMTDTKKKKYILFVILLTAFILLKGFSLYSALAEGINTIHYATLTCDYIER